MRISDWSSDVCSSDLRGKGIGRALVYGDFRAADAGPIGQLVNGIKQPGFAGICGGLGVDNPRPGRALGHPFADQQRNDGAGETDDGRKNQQLGQIQAVGSQIAANTQEIQGSAEYKQDSTSG